jgi:hypothetical protein
MGSHYARSSLLRDYMRAACLGSERVEDGRRRRHGGSTGTGMSGALLWPGVPSRGVTRPRAVLQRHVKAFVIRHKFYRIYVKFVQSVQ